MTLQDFVNIGSGDGWFVMDGLHPANKWRRYKVTASLIGWAQT